MQIFCRHGDVLVFEGRGGDLSGLVPLDHRKLALGEATGHHHSVETLQLSKEYLWIEKPTSEQRIRTFISGRELLKKFPGVDYKGGSAQPVLFQDVATGEIVFRAETTVALTHQEHGTVLLAPGGVYRSRVQREYAPEEIRRVID